MEKFRQLLARKGLTSKDYDLLKTYYGNIKDAQDAVKTKNSWQLEDLIYQIEKDIRQAQMDDILWREEQDALVYEDMENNGLAFGGGGSDSWGNSGRNALVFYLPTAKEEGFEEQAEDQVSLLEKQGYSVDKVILITDDDFVDYWNNNVSNYDDIYILTHGGAHGIAMGDTADDNLVVRGSEYSRAGEVSYVNQLDNVDSNIHLLSCNAGNLDHKDDNMMQAFDDITSGTVFASDGGVSFYPITSSVIEKINSTEVGAKIAEFIENKTGLNLTDVYPEDDYGRRLSTLKNQDRFFGFLDKINVLGIDVPKLRLPYGYYGLDDDRYIWNDDGEN